MPRLFTGIEIPETVSAQLAGLRGGVAGARWIEPSDYHVTLRFVGDVEPRVADDIVETLATVRAPPFTVEFAGLDAFGGHRPHAVVARVKPTPGLIELQSDHERRLRRLGLAPESRKFSPHVTLARLRAGTASAIADYLGVRHALSLSGFQARRFALFSAREGTGGGPYHVECAFDLG